MKQWRTDKTKIIIIEQLQTDKNHEAIMTHWQNDKNNNNGTNAKW